MTKILIAGGSLSGLLTGLSLARRGLACQLLDPQGFDEAGEAGEASPRKDVRTTALSLASWRYFGELGLTRFLEPVAQPITHIRVAQRDQSGGLSSRTLDFGPEVRPEGAPFGSIIPNGRLLRVLREACRATSRLTLTRGRLKAFEAATQRAVLEAQDSERGSVIDGVSLLIACDGRRSPCREAASIPTRTWDYGDSVLLAQIHAERPHGGVAVELFLDKPFAMLPMRENNVSLVWTEPRAVAEALMKLPLPLFTGRLRERFGPWLGAIRLVGSRHLYPVHFSLARRFFGPRLALVGDSAHAIHPIAGQGFNLAVRDIQLLAGLLASAAGHGGDVGAVPLLETYSQRRQLDVVSMAGFTDGLVHLFEAPFLRRARGLGLSMLDGMPAAKRFFAQRAMGFESRGFVLGSLVGKYAGDWAGNRAGHRTAGDLTEGRV